MSCREKFFSLLNWNYHFENRENFLKNIRCQVYSFSSCSYTIEIFFTAEFFFASSLIVLNGMLFGKAFVFVHTPDASCLLHFDCRDDVMGTANSKEKMQFSVHCFTFNTADETLRNVDEKQHVAKCFSWRMRTFNAFPLVGKAFVWVESISLNKNSFHSVLGIFASCWLQAKSFSGSIILF